MRANLPGLQLVDAEQTARQLGTTAAHQTGQPDDLSAVSVNDTFWTREPAVRPSARAGLGLSRRRALMGHALDLLTDDALDDLLGSHVSESLGEQVLPSRRMVIDRQCGTPPPSDEM